MRIRRFFTGQITAVGKPTSESTWLLEKCCWGLAANWCAGSLGAIVRSFDVRPEVKEQVESMGALFLEVDFQEDTGAGDGYAKREFILLNKKGRALRGQAKDVDIIITTALDSGSSCAYNLSPKRWSIACICAA